MTLCDCIANRMFSLTNLMTLIIVTARSFDDSITLLGLGNRFSCISWAFNSTTTIDTTISNILDIITILYQIKSL